MRETIGLLGGSFNPIHVGHLAMAEAARQELSLDRLIILPDGDPPHKSEGLASKAHRLRMAELGAAGRFEVSAMEIDRPGKTYTVDTLEALHAKHPGVLIYMIIGADTLHELPKWKTAPRVFELCHFAVFSRDNLPLLQVPGATIIKMRTRIQDISATMLRGRVHLGQSLEGFMPKAVEDYIGRHRLYDPPPLMPEEEIRRRMEQMLSPARYQHSLGVEETVRALALHWHYPDPDKAALAGLLHDCAKGMELPYMRRYLEVQGTQVDPMRKTTKALLHAPASAALARQLYGVTDPEILDAIWYHNTGSTHMGMLSKLLYLADMTEPCRHGYPWLKGLRQQSYINVDAAVQRAMSITLQSLTSRGKPAHPDTAAAYAAIGRE